MNRKVVAIVACLSAVLGLSACSGGTKSGSSEVKYIDSEAISTIAKGFEKRSDFLESKEYDSTSNKSLKKAVNIEIENDEALKDGKYKDSKLQETVISYLNTLDDSIEVLDNCSQNDADYYTKWDEVYKERSVLLKTLVRDYDLTVGDKYEDILDNIVATGNGVEKENKAKDELQAMLDAATFDKSDDGYGWYTYTATVENTSQNTYKNLSVVLAMYDSEGVRGEDGYASANTWAPGEKIKLETSSDVDAAQIKTEIEYYDLED